MASFSAPSHSRPQRPRSFWSEPRIATSGQLQRHSGFEWICKHNRLKGRANVVEIKRGQDRLKRGTSLFVRLLKTRTNQVCQTWLRACAEWREVRESRTSVVGPGQRSRFLVLTKRSAASGNENARPPFSSPEAALLLVSTKNRDLWPGPTTEVRDSRTSHHSAHAHDQKERGLWGRECAPSCTRTVKTWRICLDIELCQLKNGYSSPTSAGTPPFCQVIVINLSWELNK